MTQPADNPIRKAARNLAKLGLRPLPVLPGQKHPYIKWVKYKTNYSYLALASEFSPDKGLWTAVGRRIGYIVLDCDNDEAKRLWRERLGAQFDQTARVRTRKGLHLWWTVPTDGPEIKGWKPTPANDPEAVKIGALYDLQADGQGVMLPPSRHADDPSFVYEWEVLLEAALPAPAILLSPVGSPNAEAESSADSARTGRSILASLLSKPPSTGSRNDWHAKLAGHFIKMNVPFIDAYEAIGLALNRSLPDPDDDELVLKTWRHRWESFHEQRGLEFGTVESGWLSGDGMHLYTVVRRPIGKEQFQIDRAIWATADIIAQGVIDSESSGRTYVVSIQRNDGLVKNDLVNPGMLGNANETNKWLARHGVSAITPNFDLGGKTGHIGQRLLRYLEWQKPEAFRGVDYLGWHRDVGFVTHEGIITANGMAGHEGVMPDTSLRELAPYHYGMGDAATARQILREVLTYQDETVTAVFGAWWAATLLKGQIVDRWGHFPYFLINAASEAGKTRGFFSMMRTLSGSTKYGIGTKASVRDYIGSHRNGIVHIDDPDDVDNLAELLRAAAGEAIISKKGGDNRTTVEIKMVAPILLSGESLGLSEEKAQRDRSISIEVPSPVNRSSIRDPDRPQIDDIHELERAYPDLTDFAGTLVQLALQQAHLLERLDELRGAAGRHNEIKAIVRVGARVLAAMLADDTANTDWIIERVDTWCAAQRDMGAANTLLTRILPWALTDERWRSAASAVGHPPAYVDRGGVVWCSVARLAAEWRKECQRQGVRDRLSTDDAIRAQLRAINATTVKQQWIVPRQAREAAGAMSTRRASYIQLPESYSQMVIGELPVDETADGGSKERFDGF